jgi:hypothetical protein
MGKHETWTRTTCLSKIWDYKSWGVKKQTTAPALKLSTSVTPVKELLVVVAVGGHGVEANEA